MRVRLAVAALVNSVFINGQANMAAGPRRVYTFFINDIYISIYLLSTSNREADEKPSDMKKKAVYYR